MTQLNEIVQTPHTSINEVGSSEPPKSYTQSITEHDADDNNAAGGEHEN